MLSALRARHSDGTLSAPIGQLTDGRLYAFQVNYVIGWIKHFSAREALPWNSDALLGNTARVITYTFSGHHNNREYRYVICDQTFPSSTWVSPI